MIYRMLGAPFSTIPRHSKDKYWPNDTCLHWWTSLNRAATPPPLLTVLQTFVKEKLGGAVSFRTVALQLSSSHDLLRNIKSRLFVVIKSLIKNYLFFSERMFKNTNLMELHLVSTAILDWCITGRRLDRSAVRLEKALDFLSCDKTEIDEATGTLISRFFCKHLWMLLPM